MAEVEIPGEQVSRLLFRTPCNTYSKLTFSRLMTCVTNSFFFPCQELAKKIEETRQRFKNEYLQGNTVHGLTVQPTTHIFFANVLLSFASFAVCHSNTHVVMLVTASSKLKCLEQLSSSSLLANVSAGKTPWLLRCVGLQVDFSFSDHCGHRYRNGSTTLTWEVSQHCKLNCTGKSLKTPLCDFIFYLVLCCLFLF